MGKNKKERLRKMFDSLPRSNLKPRQVIAAIREILWPAGDEYHEWDSSTSSDIADVLSKNGFGLGSKDHKE